MDSLGIEPFYQRNHDLKIIVKKNFLGKFTLNIIT